MNIALYESMEKFKRLFLYILSAGALAEPNICLAVTDNPLPEKKGIVSFTFDDGDYSVYSKALPLFKEFHFGATAFIPTGFVGLKWQMNINDYNLNEKTKDNRYMTWAELDVLRKNGWEIGDHSSTHPNFEQLSSHKAMDEFLSSKKALVEHGFDSGSFATPFGSYHISDLGRAAKFFRTHRGFWERENLNRIEDRNNLLLSVKAIFRSTTVQQMESWIDEAARKGQWLIFAFHIVDDNPGTTNEFAYTSPTSDLRKVLQKTQELVNQKRIRVMTVQQASASRGTAIFKDSMNEGSLTNWQVEPALPLMHIDQAFNGAFPEPKMSLAIEGTSENFKIVSQPVSVKHKESSLEVELYLDKMKFKTDSVQISLVQFAADKEIKKTVLKNLDPDSIPVQRLTIQTEKLLPETDNVQLEIEAKGPSSGTLYLDEVRIGELNHQAN